MVPVTIIWCAWLIVNGPPLSQLHQGEHFQVSWVQTSLGHDHKKHPHLSKSPTVQVEFMFLFRNLTSFQGLFQKIRITQLRGTGPAGREDWMPNAVHLR